MKLVDVTALFKKEDHTFFEIFPNLCKKVNEKKYLFYHSCG